MLTQRNGGWPLTMFLTPDQLPFFGGTYFPNVAALRHARLRRPAASACARSTTSSPTTSREQSAQLSRRARAHCAARAARASTQFTRRPARRGAPTTSTPIVRPACTAASAARRSSRIPTRSSCCCAATPRSGRRARARWPRFTLRKMAEGGIYDQLGGGFARYSVDERWAIPHFEKMLYDNGWLLRLYADAWTLTREPLFARVCEETVRVGDARDAIARRRLLLLARCRLRGRGRQVTTSGAWTRSRALLDAGGIRGRRARITVSTGRPTSRTRAGTCVVARPGRRIRRESRKPARLGAREALRARETRVRPGRDEKILTSWNALMIRGMAHAARVFGREDWLDSARASLAFIRATCGRTAACSPRTRTAARTSMPISTTTPTCSRRSSRCCRPISTRPTSRGRSEIGATCCWTSSEDPVDGGFFFTVARPRAADPSAEARPRQRHALGQRRGRVGAATASRSSRASRAYPTRPSARCALFWPRRCERQPDGASARCSCALEELLTPPRTRDPARAPRHRSAPWRELLARRLPADDDGARRRRAGTAGLPAALAKPRAGELSTRGCARALPACRPSTIAGRDCAKTLALPTIAPSSRTRHPHPRSTS